MGKVVVISDLHIWGKEDPLYRALLRFSESYFEPGDKFFIIGDLFDLFIGRKKIFTQRYSELLNVFAEMAARNIEIFYIEGNHDFNLKKLTPKAKNIHVLTNDFEYEWEGKRFFFTHGDKINWKDIKYLLLRFSLRTRLAQWLIQSAPGDWIDYLGSRWSQRSRKKNAISETRALPLVRNTVQMFRNFACLKIVQGFHFVVMGHSHYFDNIKFKIDQHEGQYINAGFPRKDRKFFVLESGQSYFKECCWEDSDIWVPRCIK